MHALDIILWAVAWGAICFLVGREEINLIAAWLIRRRHPHEPKAEIRKPPKAGGRLSRMWTG